MGMCDLFKPLIALEHIPEQQNIIPKHTFHTLGDGNIFINFLSMSIHY